MIEIKNILLVGRTGSGKSALANVISGTKEFRESEYSVSGTKKIQTMEFEHQRIRYRVIDTVGIGDTKMSLDKVLYNLAKVGYVVKDGISQIWFVTGGRLEEQENSTYNLMKETVFDEKIIQYTTIVRTKFSSFKDDSECDKDKKTLSANSGEFGEVIDRIIHVDNPSMDITGEEKRMEEMRKKINEEVRKNSREVLLKYLVTYKDVYKPANLDELNKIIAKEWKNKELLKEKINKEFIKHIKERGSSLKKEVKDELKRLQKEIEERELKQATLKENELSKQIESQLVRESKELNSYLPENEKFTEWKRKIKQLKEEKVGEEERGLFNEITTEQEDIVKVIEEEIGKKEKSLQEARDNLEKKLSSVKEQVIGSVSSFIIKKGKQEKSLTQENLEKVCQAQKDFTKSKMELEIVQKILERIGNYKQKLDQQLEAKVEVFSGHKIN